MKKYLLIYLLLFVVLISFTYAINITDPVNGGNISYPASLNFTEDDLNIYNYTATMNGTFVFSALNVLSSSGGLQDYTGIYSLIGNFSINTFMFNYTLGARSGCGANADGSTYAVIYYLNGSNYTTSTLTSVSDSGCIWSYSYQSNPFPNSKVNYVLAYTKSNVVGRSTFGSIYIDYKNASNNSFSFNPYGYLTNTGTYRLNVSSYNFTKSYLNSTAINASIPFSSLLNITAKNYSGGDVLTFNVTVIELDTGFIVYDSTSSGEILVDVKIGKNYKIFASSPELASSEYNITITSASYNLTYTAFPFNSLRVYVYLESDNSNVSINAQLQFSGSTYSYEKVLNGSNDLYLLFGDDIYSVKVISAGYATRNYVVNMANGTAQTLYIYMLPTNDSSLIGINVRSLTDDIITGASVNIYKVVNSTQVPITSDLTDGTGYVAFYLVEGDKYNLIITANTYNIYPTNLTPYAINSPYYFKLAPSSSFQFKTLGDYVKYWYSPTNVSINASSQVFSFTTYSITGSVTYTNLTCNGVSDSDLGAPTGSTVSVTLNITPSTKVTCVFGVGTIGGNYQFIIYYHGFEEYATSIKASAERVKDSTSEIWLTLLSYFIMVMVAIGIKQKYPDTRIIGVVFCVGTIIFVSIGWINWIAGGVSATIGLLILYTGSR